MYPALAFTNPVLAVQAPGDDARWFVVEQAGRVLVFDNLDTVTATSEFIDITARVQDGGERGLLGMAFDPQFASNGRVFLHYTRDNGQLQSVLAAYTSADGGATLDPASESILLTVDQPFDNHNGGHLAFGPDGMLYMALGDGGSGGDPEDNAQNTRNLLGKILRIDVSSGTDYAIPTDNRWAGNARCTTRRRRRGMPGDPRLRSAQPLAIQLRRLDGRSLGRRRRPERLGGSGPHRRGRQLWLAIPRGRALLQPAERLPDREQRRRARRSRRRIRPRPRRLGDWWLRVPRHEHRLAARTLRVRRFHLGADLCAHARLR